MQSGIISATQPRGNHNNHLNKTENPSVSKTTRKLTVLARLYETLGDSARLYKTLQDSARLCKTLKDSQRLTKTLKDSQRLSKTLKDY